MKFIKYSICLTIILFSFSAGAEIYKYVDESGTIHFTDDLSNVPVEQRNTYMVSEEYQNESDDGRIVEPGVSDETDEELTEVSAEESNDFSNEIENQDDFLDSDDIAEDPQNMELDQAQWEKSEPSTSSAGTGTGDDLEAIRNQLKGLKKEIDREYQVLVKQKEQLTKEAEAIKDRNEILEHNKKVELLNKQAEAYMKKGKVYESRVEAYNEQVKQKNAKAMNQVETQ